MRPPAKQFSPHVRRLARGRSGTMPPRPPQQPPIRPCREQHSAAPGARILLIGPPGALALSSPKAKSRNPLSAACLLLASPCPCAVQAALYKRRSAACGKGTPAKMAVTLQLSARWVAASIGWRRSGSACRWLVDGTGTAACVSAQGLGFAAAQRRLGKQQLCGATVSTHRAPWDRPNEQGAQAGRPGSSQKAGKLRLSVQSIIVVPQPRAIAT